MRKKMKMGEIFHVRWDHEYMDSDKFMKTNVVLLSSTWSPEIYVEDGKKFYLTDEEKY